MAEFPLPVLQIWRSRKWVAIQIQLMNIHVSECKYYCLHFVPKFGDVCDRQNWRLHPTVHVHIQRYLQHNFLFPNVACPSQLVRQFVAGRVACMWLLAFLTKFSDISGLQYAMATCLSGCKILHELLRIYSSSIRHRAFDLSKTQDAYRAHARHFENGIMGAYGMHCKYNY